MAKSLVQLLRDRLVAEAKPAQAYFEDHLETVVACSLPTAEDEEGMSFEERWAGRNQYMDTWKWADTGGWFGPRLVHSPSEKWPAELPHPLTVGVALDLVASNLDGMADEIARTIEAAVDVLVEPEYQPAVLARRELLTRSWPWPFRKSPLWFARYAASFEPRVGPNWEDPTGPVTPQTYWHAKAKPIDVARWARDGLNRLNPSMGTDLYSVTERTGLPEPIAWTTDEGFQVHVPPMGLALLYLAWDAIRLGVPSTPTVALLSVETAPVRLVTSMAGVDARELNRDAEIWTDEADPTRLVFEWDDGEQIELDYAGADANPLMRIAERYGIAAVRDLLGLYLFTWAARAPAGDSLWWWPDEHLALTGLAQGKDGRCRLRTWLRRMKQTRLKVHYATGNPLSGPVVTESATDGAAYRLHLHPSLYRGVTSESGRPGNYWWPVSVELLRLPADRSAGKVHVLAVVLGQQWRAELRKNPAEPPVARIAVDRLAEKLAIRPQGGRNIERRAADTLRATLEAGERGGLVGGYRVERGNLDALSGVLVITPGAEALRIRKEGRVAKAAWLPATGGDVAAWLQRMGLTSDAAGDVLDIPGPTLRRVCSTHRNRPLPPRVRAAFRRHLWPGLE